MGNQQNVQEHAILKKDLEQFEVILSYPLKLTFAAITDIFSMIN